MFSAASLLSALEFLGKVSPKELVDLCSNALSTIFPFTNETFGYFPLESMACGTPVLTHDFQGPSEHVVNAHTGWLVHTDLDRVQKSVEFGKEHLLEARTNCVTASNFDEILR